MTNFFGPGSPFVGHPLLTAERTRLEVDRVLEWCAQPPQAVLDVGCGFGRHAVEFARRGLEVVAIDPSPTMIAESRSNMVVAGVEAEFVQASGEDFVRPESFDLVVCLFTTFGQITSGSSDDAPCLLSNARASLRGSGSLVIEVPELDRARNAMVAHEQLGPSTVTRSFDETTSQMHERFVTPAGEFNLAYRLFSRDELLGLVETAGFEIQEFNSQALVPPPETFMTVVASCSTG